MEPAPEHERFAANTKTLLQAIHDGVRKLSNEGHRTADPMLVQFAIGIVGSYDKHRLISGFIRNSHQVCWDHIFSREEAFFVENAQSIFKDLPMDKVDLFRDLFTTKDASGKNVMSQQFKNDIWAILGAMVKISIKYVHKGREPYSYLNNGTMQNAYSREFFNDVDIGHHSNLWGVKLDFPAKM